MDSKRAERCEHIFASALEMPDAQRRAYLEEACGSDLDMRQEVESLLAAYAAAGDFIERPACSFTFLESPLSAGGRIGGYELVRILGQGGMGAVFEARQATPRRTVALKLLNRGAVSQETVRRFNYESQVLARLDHPGVARVYEAGMHQEPAGPAPYLVMEYVDGARDLLTYAREKHLSTEQRLQLFIQICEAVHHGHQRGVIHRDLKPGNLLVDAAGQPKVIDFGIARGLDDGEDAAARTRTGQLLGTLPYMSPEQCRGGADAVDVRTDVYALGVILFELLTGAMPYDVRNQPALQAVQIITEQPPARLGRAAPHLRGDVEAIVDKALAKEPHRRYAGAADLGRDLERYLRRLPIEARRSTWTYRFGRFAARHRAAAAIGMAVAVLLTTAIVVMVQQAGQVRIERDRAERANAFLTEMLAAADPAAYGPDVSLRTVVDAAARTAQDELAGDPALAASIHDTLGQTYRSLGDFDAAREHFTLARDLYAQTASEDAPSTLRSEANRATVLLDQGLLPDAEAALDAVYARQAAMLGEHAQDTLRTAATRVTLLRSQGRLDDAEDLGEAIVSDLQGMADPPDDLTFSLWNSLAIIAAEQGEMDQAADRFDRLASMLNATIGRHSPDALFALNSLAVWYQKSGQNDRAESILRENLTERKEVLGAEHPAVFTAMNNLGTFLMSARRLEAAEPLLQEALQQRQKIMGERHTDTLTSLHNLGMLRTRQGRLDEAEELYRRALAGRTEILGPEHERTLKTQNNLAMLLRSQGRLDEAAGLLESLIDVQARVLGETHPDRLWTISNLAALLQADGKLNRAESLLRQAHTAAQSVLPAEHWHIAKYAAWLGGCLLAQERYEEAEAYLLEGYNGLVNALGTDHYRTHWAVEHLVKLYDAWGRPDDADLWRAKIPAKMESPEAAD